MKGEVWKYFEDMRVSYELHVYDGNSSILLTVYDLPDFSSMVQRALASMKDDMDLEIRDCADELLTTLCRALSKPPLAA